MHKVPCTGYQVLVFSLQHPEGHYHIILDNIAFAYQHAPATNVAIHTDNVEYKNIIHVNVHIRI